MQVPDSKDALFHVEKIPSLRREGVYFFVNLASKRVLQCDPSGRCSCDNQNRLEWEYQVIEPVENGNYSEKNVELTLAGGWRLTKDGRS